MSKIDKRIISLVLIMLLALSYAMPVVSKATTAQSVIKDKILESQFVDVNKDGIISKEDVENTRYIEIPAGVRDLSGLEYAKNIKTLEYTYDGTKLDFSPLNQEAIEYLTLNIQTKTIPNIEELLGNYSDLNSLQIKTLEKANVNLTILKKHPNLEFLELNNVNVSNLNDIVNLKNLTTLGICNSGVTVDLTNIDKLTKLDYIYIEGCSVKNLNGIGKLTQLLDLALTNCTGITNKLNLNNEKLVYVNFAKSDIQDISFAKNLKNLRSLNISETKVTEISALKGLEKLQYVNVREAEISDKEKASLIRFEDYKAYIGEKKYLEPTITGIYYFSDWQATSNNENIVSIDENGRIHAIAAGEATISITGKTNPFITKTMKVTVKGINGEQPSGSTMGSNQITDDIILKANGELWKIYTKESKAEKIATNVKKYVYEFVYTKNGDSFPYSLLQKKDGSVEYKFNGVKTTLKGAKDIYHNGYLKTDGTYYEITEKGTWEKVTDHVEKIVGSYLVKTDGKTYTVTNQLVANFKIVAANAYTIVDENKNVWRVNMYEDNVRNVTKVGANFKNYVDQYNDYGLNYLTTDGKIMDYYGNESTEMTIDYIGENRITIDKSGNAKLNDTVILTKVVLGRGISEYNEEEDKNYNKVILIREDGTIWCLHLSGEGKLEKIVEQAEKVFLANNSLKVTARVMVPSEVLTGFDIKKLKVQDIASNFKSTYVSKIYKNGKEITGNAKVGTGTTIKLYNAQNKLVKEYTALVYGDVTGSGSPSSADALAIIKNKTGKKVIENELLLEAARVTPNTRKTGGAPSSADALAIIKAKLGKYTIDV